MAVGAASLRPEIGRLFSAAGIYIVEGYGMTEAAPLISMNRFEPGLNRFGTVGISLPGIEVRIDNPNENHEGEILVKGPNVMKGYFKKQELTAEAISADGWLHTGDLGRVDEDGYLYITGRKKDLIIKGGENISPREIEEAIYQHPAVSEAAVIGIPTKAKP